MIYPGTLARMPAALLLLISVIPVSAQVIETGFEAESVLISGVLELEPGLTVADVGAGEGRYSLYLADQVGSSGRVYATEIVPDLVDGLREVARGRDNLTVLLGLETSTELPVKCCDRILLRRVFHHIHNPEAMLASLLTSLKPGGMLLIIDFLPQHNIGRHDATPEDGVHGTTVQGLVDQVTANGFELVRQIQEWPSRIDHGQSIDFAVLFQRP